MEQFVKTKFKRNGISLLIISILVLINCDHNPSHSDNYIANDLTERTSSKKHTIQSVSVSSHQPGYGPSNTFDGNLDYRSRWSAFGKNEWIKYELANEQYVSSVDILFWFLEGYYYQFKFSIELSSNDIDWKRVYSGASSYNARGYENYSFFPEKIKYIKIICHGNSDDDWNSIIEVRINQEMRHKIHSVSASTWEQGRLPSNTFDGNIYNESRWSSLGLNEVITYDLGEEQNVSSIDIMFFRGDDRRSFFSIELSLDGVDWEQVFDGVSTGASHDFEKFDFADSKARYVKFIGYGNTMNDWNSIIEAQINGNIISEISSWSTTIGGDFKDTANSVQQTRDGGYIAAGESRNDMYIIKLDNSGDERWSKKITGNKANSIHRTYGDDGFVIAGETQGDMSILRLDSSGNEIWNKRIGGDSAKSIDQTRDGGFVVAGHSMSPSTRMQMQIVKLDENGNVIWYRSSVGAVAKSIEQTRDGGYIIGGHIGSGAGIVDMYILKLDASGNEMWNKIISSKYICSANAVQQTRDGGYIVAGERINDMYIVKLDGSGNIVWDRSYGHTGMDSANSILQTDDGGYIAAGEISYYASSLCHMYILKIDSSGNETWSKIFKNKKAASIQECIGGGYIVAGATSSKRNSDMYIMKLDSNGECEDCQ